eukprot:COSAG06_NODE_9807_length_1812_cov_1.398132_1_plen_276_part_10
MLRIDLHDVSFTEWAQDELAELESQLAQQLQLEQELESEPEPEPAAASTLLSEESSSSFGGVDDFGSPTSTPDTAAETATAETAPTATADAATEEASASSSSSSSLSLPTFTITTSADLTVDVRFDVIVNSVSPEFQSSGSDSGINFSVWKTLTGWNDDGEDDDGEKPPPIQYDQEEFLSRNGGRAPTYGDVLWSELPADAVMPEGSALKYIVHALAPDCSHRPKRLPSGLDRAAAYSALVAVYFRAMWQGTALMVPASPRANCSTARWPFSAAEG